MQSKTHQRLKYECFLWGQRKTECTFLASVTWQSNKRTDSYWEGWNLQLSSNYVCPRSTVVAMSSAIKRQSISACFSLHQDSLSVFLSPSSPCLTLSLSLTVIVPLSLFLSELTVWMTSGFHWQCLEAGDRWPVPVSQGCLSCCCATLRHRRFCTCWHTQTFFWLIQSPHHRVLLIASSVHGFCVCLHRHVHTFATEPVTSTLKWILPAHSACHLAHGKK